MPGPNDQQTESLSGQMVILAGHCLLTGRYFGQMKKKKKQSIFTIFHLFQPCLPRFLAGSSSKLLCTVLSPHQMSWTWIACCRCPSKLEHFLHPLGRRNQSVLYQRLFLPGSTACKTEEENVTVNTNGGKCKPLKNHTRFSFCAKTACIAD